MQKSRRGLGGSGRAERPEAVGAPRVAAQDLRDSLNIRTSFKMIEIRSDKQRISKKKKKKKHDKFRKISSCREGPGLPLSELRCPPTASQACLEQVREAARAVRLEPKRDPKRDIFKFFKMIKIRPDKQQNSKKEMKF